VEEHRLLPLPARILGSTQVVMGEEEADTAMALVGETRPLARDLACTGHQGRRRVADLIGAPPCWSV
jgi:hypothetical protein